MTPKKEPLEHISQNEHPSSAAFRWWYFDALSDEGRDAVTVTFFDNYIFSPRYNSPNQPDAKFPAVVFSYYRNGKLKYRAIEEVTADDFEVWKDGDYCRVGRSSFSYNTAPYGTGYAVTVDAPLGKNRRIEVSLEWLNVEYGGSSATRAKHTWRLASARSDVTGKITIRGKGGRIEDTISFRGSGCCEYESDSRPLHETTSGWQWGRAHFADATAIFCRTLDEKENEARCDLYVIKNEELREFHATCQQENLRRSFYLTKYPGRLIFTTENGIKLKVKQARPLESNFYYERFLSEMTLTLRDGNPRKTVGISEQFSAKALSYKWLRWISR